MLYLVGNRSTGNPACCYCCSQERCVAPRQPAQQYATMQGTVMVCLRIQQGTYTDQKPFDHKPSLLLHVCPAHKPDSSTVRIINTHIIACRKTTQRPNTQQPAPTTLGTSNCRCSLPQKVQAGHEPHPNTMAHPRTHTAHNPRPQQHKSKAIPGSMNTQQQSRQNTPPNLITKQENPQLSPTCLPTKPYVPQANPQQLLNFARPGTNPQATPRKPAP